MALRQIRIEGDEILRKHARKVEEIGKIVDIEPSKVKLKIDKLMIKLKYNGKKEWIDEN